MHHLPILVAVVVQGQALVVETAVEVAAGPVLAEETVVAGVVEDQVVVVMAVAEVAGAVAVEDTADK